MTTNQIAYFKAVEERRHNLASEHETIRHDFVTEGETHRHAKAQEAIDSEKNAITREYNLGTLDHFVRGDTEQARSNRANELIKAQQLAETTRHDVAQEQIDYEKNRISQMANIVRQNELAETTRHDLATEQLTRTKQVAEIDKLKAEAESIRSNTSLDTVRFDQIKADTLLKLEQNKQTGWESLLTQARIENVQKDTQLKSAQTEKALMDAGFVPINSWSNAVGSVGRLFSGVLSGLSIGSPNASTWSSSATYNAQTGLYE